MTEDLPEPDGPARTRVSPAATRNDRPSSAGPREASQVRRTLSKVTVTPCAATVRISRAGTGSGSGGRSISDFGRAGGVQAILIGGRESSQRGEEFRRQQQYGQRRPQNTACAVRA